MKLISKQGSLRHGFERDGASEGGLTIELEDEGEDVVYIRIVHDDVVLLKEPVYIRNDLNEDPFKLVSFCFTSKVTRDVHRYCKKQSFQVSVLHPSRKVCNILNYVVSWNELIIYQQWLDLDKAISLSLTGQNLVVVRDGVQIDDVYLSWNRNQKCGRETEVSSLCFVSEKKEYFIEMPLQIKSNSLLSSDLTKSSY